MKLLQITIALSLLLSANVGFSIPLRDVEKVDLTALQLDGEKKQLIEELLGLRAAYRAALSSLNSYNMSFGVLTYTSEERMEYWEKNLGTPKFVFEKQPQGILTHIKRYGNRYLQLEESVNRYRGYLSDEDVVKYAPTKNDTQWKVIDGNYGVNYANAEIMNEIKGKDRHHYLIGQDYVKNGEIIDPEKPYHVESQLWDVVNNIDFEEMIGGLIRGTAKLMELERITYEGTEALSIYLTYPEYDGAYKAVYSLEPSDYGQPLYFYQRSGCRDCDIHNRTSIPVLEIQNISYVQEEIEFNKFIPVPSAFEHIRTDMGETMEIHHYFLMDSAFNSIQSEDELKIPIKAEDRFEDRLDTQMPGVFYSADEIPSPWSDFVRIEDEPKVGFSDQTVEELQHRSIAMNPSVEEMVLQAKTYAQTNDRFNMTHVAVGLGGILMAAGGIISIRRKKS